MGGYWWLWVVIRGWTHRRPKQFFWGWLWVVMGVSVLVMSDYGLVVSVNGWLSVVTVGNGGCF